MRRATRWIRVAALLAMGLAAGGAKGGDVAGFLFLIGALIALGLIASLPAALMLHTWRPALIARVARAYGERKTAALVVGAGLALGSVLVTAILMEYAWRLGMVGLTVLYAYVLVGMAGCARRQGVRMLSGELETDDERRPRPLVLGWLTRAGAVACPLLWPLLATYVACSALGAPVVALFAGRRPSED
jgi:hypothetical protein